MGSCSRFRAVLSFPSYWLQSLSLNASLLPPTFCLLLLLHSDFCRFWTMLLSTLRCSAATFPGLISSTRTFLLRMPRIPQAIRASVYVSLLLFPTMLRWRTRWGTRTDFDAFMCQPGSYNGIILVSLLIRMCALTSTY